MRIIINGRPATLHIFEPTHWEREVLSIRFDGTNEFIPRDMVPTIAHYVQQGVREFGGLEYSTDDQHSTYEVFE